MPRFYLQDTALAPYEREMMAVPGFGLRRITESQDSGTLKPMYSLREYRFPTGEGSFVGTLVHKRWNGRNGINCYFDSDDALPIKICAWVNYERGTGCRPKHSNLDVTTLELGTVLRVTYRTTKSGKTSWLCGEILSPPINNI